MAERSAARVIREDNGVIAGEHTVLVVRGTDEAPVASPWDGNSLVTVYDDPMMGGDFWVNTGDQWGPYAVTTHLLDGEPHEPDEEWEDVVELSVQPTSALVVTEMIDNEPAIALIDEPGAYRLRVSARGRQAQRGGGDPDDVARDEDGPPIEWYLLEVWPAPPAEPNVLRMTSSYAEAQLNPPARLAIPEGEAGLAAAARIGRDVDQAPGARVFGGELGALRVERTIRGTRRKLFTVCAHLTNWTHVWLGPPSWSMSGGGGEDVGSETWGYSDDHPDQLSGSTGAVRWVFVEVKKPERVVRSWNWVRRIGDRGPSLFIPGVDVLAQDSSVTVTLTQSQRDGEPWTTIVVEHGNLPVEWLVDMEYWWRLQLAIADHSNLGARK